MGKIEAFFFLALIIAAASLAVVIAKEHEIISITGLASSGTAITSVNLSEEISIKTTGSIDFGNGRVNSDALNANLDSDAGTVVGGTWAATQGYIMVENDGTVNISINLSAEGDKNAEGFIGGTSPEFQMKAIETEADACLALQTAYTDIPNSTETPINICDNLNFAQNKDEFNVSAKLVIPNDAVAGQRNVTLTFSASKV